MKNKQKGFTNYLIILCLLVIGGGAYLYFYKNSFNSSKISEPERVGVDKMFDEIVFSRNSPFAVMSETNSGYASHLSGENLQGIGILDTRTNSYKTLTDKNGIIATAQNPDYSIRRSIFSPSGKLLIYPVVKRDADLVGTNEYGTYTYYYDLYLYDTDKGESYLLTKDRSNMMYYLPGSTTGFPGTDGQLLGWTDNETIIYTCGNGKEKTDWKNFSQRICSVDVDTRQIITTGVQKGQQVTKAPPTLKILSNEGNNTEYRYGSSNGQSRNNNGNLSIVDENIRSFNKLIQKISVDDGTKKEVIFTGDYEHGLPHFDDLYWSSDDHIYGRTQGNQLFRLR